MKLLPTSLGGRLLVGTMLFTLLALTVTLVVMDRVLERFVTGQIDQRLDNKLVALASQARIADGVVALDGDANGPPFDEPRHMSFWRVEGPKNAIQSHWLPVGAFRPPSRAEIDAAPFPPRPPHDRVEESARPHPRTLRLVGPAATQMHVRLVERTLAGTPVTILAAAPMRAIDDPMREALATLAGALIVVGLGLGAASFTLVRITLAPLARLRRDIADIRSGAKAAVVETQPIEIKPLVDEVNSLLAQNAANLERARKHVANLAHGLKTPLATLSLGVARLRDGSRGELQPLVETIERRVRHHLRRARAAALEGPMRQQTALAAHLDDICGALQKVYAEKRIDVRADCPAHAVVACEPQDIDEIFGNLLDNAFKYARRRVDCRVGFDGTRVTVTILDDGPGLAAEDVARVMRPGQRLDEQVPGFGFGLPIARELVELYAGDLLLTARPHGLEVKVTLPRAPSA